MIQTEPEGIEQIRARLRKMTDRELREYGRAARDLSDPNSARRSAEGMAAQALRVAVEREPQVRLTFCS